MPTILSYRPLRLFCDVGNPNRVLDQRTALPPIITRGSATGFELALGVDGEVFTGAISGTADTLSYQVRDSSDPASTLRLEDTIAGADLNDALTQAAWNARTAYHARSIQSAAQCNIAAGTYWLTVWFATDAGDKTIVLSGPVTVVEDGAGLGTTPDDLPLGYTTAEADALFIPRTPALGTFRVITNEDGTFWQLKDSATGLWSTIWLDSGALQIGPGTA